MFKYEEITKTQAAEFLSEGYKVEKLQKVEGTWDQNEWVECDSVSDGQDLGHKCYRIVFSPAMRAK